MYVCMYAHLPLHAQTPRWPPGAAVVYAVDMRSTPEDETGNFYAIFSRAPGVLPAAAWATARQHAAAEIETRRTRLYPARASWAYGTETCGPKGAPYG